ncbi:MAG: hypothetical protein ACKVXR_17035 [Planctomycetota bacterium]
MSYDLLFVRRPDSDHDEEELFRRHFANRPRIQLKGAQAWYENEDTGVYFSFELDESGGGDDPIVPGMWSSFNINFMRPHVFALEAAPEIAAFVQAVRPLIFDPQSTVDAPDSKPSLARVFDTDAFITGWNFGNQAGYRVVAEEDVEARNRAMPRALIDAVWRWNFTRESRMTDLQNAVFIPRVLFLAEEGGIVATAVIWPDAIPVRLPVVDRVIVGREKLAKRTLLPPLPKMAYCTWAELETQLQGHPRHREGFEWVEVTKQPPAKELVQFLRRLPSFPKDVKPLAHDMILDEELFP